MHRMATIAGSCAIIALNSGLQPARRLLSQSAAEQNFGVETTSNRISYRAKIELITPLFDLLRLFGPVPRRR